MRPNLVLVREEGMSGALIMVSSLIFKGGGKQNACNAMVPAKKQVDNCLVINLYLV
jgi:hypothetical protein